MIRPYKPGEEKEIVALWNNILKKDLINLEVFERKVLLDPNFEREGLLVAEKNGKLVGFSYNIIRKYPILDCKEVERDKNKGWIVAFGALSEDVGNELIERSLEFHRKRKKRIVLYSPYVPNYFFPGIDSDAYPLEYKILVANGFVEIKSAESLAMDSALWPGFRYPNVKEIEEKLESEEIRIVQLSTSYITPFLEFLRESMPEDWYRHARELLLHDRKRQIFVAVKGKEVVGYCQFWDGEGYEWYMPGSHFGPFGVREDMRGRGIGTILLYNCLKKMKEYGIHNAFVLWTGEEARRLYERFGFRVTRVFKILERVIE